jgi:hypothetical protein
LTNQKSTTRTTNGEKIYTCSHCGDTKTEIINATEHSYTKKLFEDDGDGKDLFSF